MRVFALSDPHLSLGTPGKEMDRFGPHWVNHTEKMAAAWDAKVRAGDMVLVPGDISWARDIAGAAPDLAWLAARPGTKLLVKGNHEHWWPESRARLRTVLPPGVHPLIGDAVRMGGVSVCGTRLWEVPGVSYHDVIAWQGEPISPELTPEEAAAARKVYQRELQRLDRALSELDGSAPLRIAMLHYPPLGPGLQPNELSERFERACVNHVVFGHLHSLDPKARKRIGGTLNGVRYHLTACDFIDFAPTLIAEV
jgi:predicted phosphohydrolase